MKGQKKGWLAGVFIILLAALSYFFVFNRVSEDSVGQAQSPIKTDLPQTNTQALPTPTASTAEVAKSPEQHQFDQLLAGLFAQDKQAWNQLSTIDLNQRLEFNRTPLMVLAFERQSAAVELLLKRGATVNDVDDSGQNALMNALNGGSAATALMILKYPVNVSHVDHSGQSALHYAVGLGDVSVMERLLTLGADPNLSANRAGYTMLMDLAHEGQWQAVNLFVKFGARFDLQDNEGNSVLHHAVMSGSRETVESVLKTGISRSLTNRKGQTAADLAQRLELSLITDLINNS